MNQNSCRFSESHGRCGKHTHTEKRAFPPILGNKNTLINVQCCISNNTCQPTLLLFYHSCTFIVFEHCLSPSQHSSCCLPLCPISAFSLSKCNQCVMRVVFQPAKPAISPLLAFHLWLSGLESCQVPAPGPPAAGTGSRPVTLASPLFRALLAIAKCYLFQGCFKLDYNTAR